MSHHVIVLADGTEVGFYGDGNPSPELMKLLAEIVAAVAELSPAQLRAIAARRRQEVLDRHRHELHEVHLDRRRRR